MHDDRHCQLINADTAAAGDAAGGEGAAGARELGVRTREPGVERDRGVPPDDDAGCDLL